MQAPIECAGAPRDIGLDQGRACRAELWARFAALPGWRRLAWRLGAGSPAALLREVARHFPHQAESLAGLAVGARVPRGWLAARLAARAPGAAVALGGDGARVAWRTEGPGILRRSRPEGLFASVEWTRPELPFALAGVNERGLAVAVAGETVGASVPAVLLAQDCLERFARLDAALEWCATRPATGDAVLLLADETGEVGGVEVLGGGRRVLRPADGRLFAGRAADAADLAKALDGAVDPEGVLARLGAEVVLLDPRTRRLAVGEARLVATA